MEICEHYNYPDDLAIKPFFGKCESFLIIRMSTPRNNGIERVTVRSHNLTLILHTKGGATEKFRFPVIDVKGASHFNDITP